LARANGRDRLIVALDLPTVDEASRLVDCLGDEVSFYKVGWELFMTGELPKLLDRLQERRIFLDLKIPGDIPNTVGAVVERCAKRSVELMTVSDFMPDAAIQAARNARAGREHPKLLVVPMLSSLDASDLEAMGGRRDLEAYVIERADRALRAGCDGLVVSGQAIRALRRRFPEATIVSPGIRLAGAPTDDHKRSTTPREAIAMGADYIVVGRPIRLSAGPRNAAREIVAEIDAALERPIC
jgi:orotidine-5'-phosphate decarboxylase